MFKQLSIGGSKEDRTLTERLSDCILGDLQCFDCQSTIGNSRYEFSYNRFIFEKKNDII